MAMQVCSSKAQPTHEIVFHGVNHLKEDRTPLTTNPFPKKAHIPNIPWHQLPSLPGGVSRS